MATKAKTVETVVDVKDYEVTDVAPKKTVSKRKAKKVAETIVEEAEAELNGENISGKLPQKRVSDDGTINTENLPAQKKAYYAEIAKVLDEKDLTSISSYGSDLQRAMDTYSNDFLSQQMDSRTSIESAELISNLLGELHEVNIDDLEAPSKMKRFLRKIPMLRKLVVSVEQIKAKYNTIQKNIDGIVNKLEATRQIAIRDNNLLQKQFENNCDYVSQLEDLIIAGKIKSDELGTLIEDMKSRVGEYEDYQISDIEEYKNSLDKRLTDLTMLRYAFKQSLTQIRIFFIESFI